MPVTREDYAPSVTKYTWRALLEVAVALKPYREDLVLVGGWVPYILLAREGKRDLHPGSIDMDFVISPRVSRKAYYETIAGLLKQRGYRETAAPFRFDKVLSTKAGEVRVLVDFLVEPEWARHVYGLRTLQPGVRAFICSGCEVAARHSFDYLLKGALPGGARAQATLRVADVIGSLTTKGLAIKHRLKEKDPYDIYTLLKHYGPERAAREFTPLRNRQPYKAALELIRRQFHSPYAIGPTGIATFTLPGGTRTAQLRVQKDAYRIISRFFEVLDKK
jgi:hypothetical protein